MNDPNRWSLDEDPPRDAALARLLRAADGAGESGVDWEGLRAAILRGAAGAGRGLASDGSGQWWDVVLEWRRVAVAASVAAMLAAGALLWRTGAGADGPALAADTAPESVALARLVAAYPDDSVLTSLLATAGDDALTNWEPR